MKRTILLFMLGFFWWQSLQATELCTAQALEHPVIKERAKIMHMRGDRTITLVGHVHGDRRALRKFGNWARNPDVELSNQEWLSRVTEYIDTNAKALEHAKQDLSFLRASLWEAQQPLFVGMESQDDDLTAHVQQAMGVRSELWKAFWQRELEDIALLRDAELLTLGGVLYSYLYDSELKDKYELEGLENTEEGVRLQKEGMKKMRTAEKRLASIKAKKGLDQAIIDEAMAYVVDVMNAQYDDIADILAYDHEMIRGTLEDKYRNLEPDVRGAALLYLYGYLDYLRGMKKRDVFFARKLAGNERSGIFFVGQEHLESISKLLEIECHQIRQGKTLHEQGEQPVLEEM